MIYDTLLSAMAFLVGARDCLYFPHAPYLFLLELLPPLLRNILSETTLLPTSPSVNHPHFLSGQL